MLPTGGKRDNVLSMTVLPQTRLIDPMAARLGYQLRRASALIMADLSHHLEQYDLRPTEATVLIVIRANPACSQTDVCKLLGLKRANMVPVIARLGERGLVERTAVDGRSQSLALTKKGQSLTEKVEASIKMHDEHFQRQLESAQLGQIFAALQVLRRTRKPS
jgi:DNA-binding MarR family transcriptional regulator